MSAQDLKTLLLSQHPFLVLDTAGLLREIQRTVPLAVSRREEIDRPQAFAVGRFVPVTSPLEETGLSA
jgi:hypothetical protein